MKRDDISSLAHSKWNCKYHEVLVPKHPRKVFYGTQRLEIGQILKQLCNWYGVTRWKQKLVQIIFAFLCRYHLSIQYLH